MREQASRQSPLTYLTIPVSDFLEQCIHEKIYQLSDSYDKHIKIKLQNFSQASLKYVQHNAFRSNFINKTVKLSSDLHKILSHHKHKELIYWEQAQHILNQSKQELFHTLEPSVNKAYLYNYQLLINKYFNLQFGGDFNDTYHILSGSNERYKGRKILVIKTLEEYYRYGSQASSYFKNIIEEGGNLRFELYSRFTDANQKFPLDSYSYQTLQTITTHHFHNHLIPYLEELFKPNIEHREKILRRIIQTSNDLVLLRDNTQNRLKEFEAIEDYAEEIIMN